MDTQKHTDQIQASANNTAEVVSPVPITDILEKKEDVKQASPKSILKDPKDTDSEGIKQAHKESKSKNNSTQKEKDSQDTPSSELNITDAAKQSSTNDFSKESLSESETQSASSTDQAHNKDKNPLHEDPDFLKLQESFDETRKWGRDLSKKIHGFKRQVESYLQEGVLTEEEAQNLLKHASHPDTAEEEHPLFKYSKIWDQEVQNIKKYTRDAAVDQNILAFQHLLKHADSDDLSALLEELAAVDKNPLELTHKMLQMGKDYHASTYGPLMEAGGMQNMLKTHRKETHKLQQQIDKLEAELVKLRRNLDDNTAGYSLPDGGSFGDIPESTLTLSGALTKGLKG